MLWSTMRMEMRLNQLKTELELLTKSSTASTGSSSETIAGSPSSSTGVTTSSSGTTNSCSLEKLLQDQFKNVPIEIKINQPNKQTSINSTVATSEDPEAPLSDGELSSCSEANKTGIYRVKINVNTTERVLCDAEFEKGGWVVIQHRFNGSVDFYRKWTEYENGFGKLSGEFWLGNEKITKLTAEKPREIAFVMEDFDDVKAIAKYNAFQMGSKLEKYSLKSLGSISGNVGDSLSRNVGSKFSTHDMDNDKSSSHCAQLYRGGWWYDDCHLANLNGKYLKGSTSEYATSMCWSSFKGFHYSLKTSRIMVRF
ncbi:hypothetical protein ZHAS_00022136 [Anopheles sinensis]|uniref:Fibrinogen C-terminal domain-containing protein n=1 Tax=Anopheles sinensis TaxID=74873 RepID=A0A084WU61_ANOSI|nr:hypothetical protein ZHAS_00022136 [Anopheles sinensis]